MSGISFVVDFNRHPHLECCRYKLPFWNIHQELYSKTSGVLFMNSDVRCLSGGVCACLWFIIYPNSTISWCYNPCMYFYTVTFVGIFIFVNWDSSRVFFTRTGVVLVITKYIFTIFMCYPLISFAKKNKTTSLLSLVFELVHFLGRNVKKLLKIFVLLY